MLQLLDFLYRWRIFLLFLLLEGISFWLILSYNHRYNTYYLNSSNRITGEISSGISNVEKFFDLRKVNRELAEENLTLRKALADRARELPIEKEADDSSLYSLALAKVVNASHRKSRNYLTLRINSEDSIMPGMGVVSADGVVGTIKSTSRHFATVISVLHPNLQISGRVQSNNALATVLWDGENSLEAELKYVPRHLKLEIGDQIVTSGFNAIYPEGFVIGKVSRSELKRESPFYTAKIRLATDFTNINTVYVIKVKDKEEKEQVEQEIFE